MSPLALYFFYREITGEIDVDYGVYNRTMMKVLSENGAPLESLWPYDLSLWKTRPSNEAYDDAKARLTKHPKIIYRALYTVEEMINCVAEGYGFLGGIPVYESFLEVGTNGVVQMPDRNEKFLGGHDLFFWGYDRNNKWLYFQNSWGFEFGNNGHGVLPFEYAEKMLLDGWTIRFEQL
jgi:C1A family cysteine protease